jgi:hypothetical protein
MGLVRHYIMFSIVFHIFLFIRLPNKKAGKGISRSGLRDASIDLYFPKVQNHRNSIPGMYLVKDSRNYPYPYNYMQGMQSCHKIIQSEKQGIAVSEFMQLLRSRIQTVTDLSLHSKYLLPRKQLPGKCCSQQPQGELSIPFCIEVTDMAIVMLL